jgi:hypothetical protein
MLWEGQTLCCTDVLSGFALYARRYDALLMSVDEGFS